MISQKDWRKKQAAVQAFGCLVDGPSKQKIQQLVVDSLDGLFNFLGDQNKTVIAITAKTLNKIACVYPEFYLAHQNFPKFLNKILSSLEKSLSISSSMLKIILHFFSCPNKKLQESLLINIDRIITALIKNAYRKDNKESYNIIQLSLFTLSMIFYTTKNPMLCKKYFASLVVELKKTFGLIGEHKTFLQNGILACIQAIVTIIDEDLTNDDSQKIYQLVKEVFTNVGDVNEEGMNVISWMAIAIGQRFDPMMDDYWKYIKHTFTKENEEVMIKAAIFAVSESSKASGGRFQQYLPVIFPTLMQILQSNGPRSVKVEIFGCFGDIFTGTKVAAFQYMDDVMKVIFLAYQGLIQLHKSTKNEDIEYCENLQDKILESLICFCHAFQGTGQEDKFLQHLPKIFQCLEATCKKEMDPSIEYIRNSLAFISDLAMFYQAKVSKLVKSQFTENLFKVLGKHTNNKENQDMVEYACNCLGININSLKNL